MNLKYFLGAGYFRTIEAVVSLPAFPLTRYFPRGVFWMFDIQRFLETRSLGVLFDVGANVGQTLKTLLRHAPDAKIYGFEPAVETFRVLQANFGDRRNVDLRNVALGAHPDRRVLQLSEDSQLNTLMPRDTQGVWAMPRLEAQSVAASFSISLSADSICRSSPEPMARRPRSIAERHSGLHVG